MKKLFTLLATFALFGLFAQAQVTQTIGTSGGNQNVTPFGNGNAKMWSQSIYTSTEIGYTAGGTISAIAYNCAAATSMSAEDVTIYMANTTRTINESTSDWIQTSELTQVYHSTSFQQPATNGWFTITLDTPFDYTGGSLAIVIARDGVKATGEKYYYTSTSNTFLFKLGSSTLPATTGTRNAYRADIKLTLTPNPANLPPDAVSASATTTGASLTWTTSPYALAADSYKVEYGLRGFTPGTGTLVSPAPTTEACSLTGLTAGTWYDVYVSSVKGGETSSARKATFHTETAPLALPYTLTYVAGQMVSYSQASYSVDGEIPLGWDFPGIAADQPQVWYDGDAMSSSIYLRTNNSAPAVAVLPVLDADLRKVVIGFTASISGTLEYGYWNGGVFTALGTAIDGANSIDLEDLGANIPSGARLAFRMTSTSAALSNSIVSGITVDHAPACKVPTGLAVDEATRNASAFTMRWGGVQNEGDKYHVVLKKGGVTVGDYSNITDQYYAFTGLDSAAGYDVYVSKVCGGSEETDQAHATVYTYWAVRTAVNNAAMGSVTGNASGPNGSNTTLTAVPNEGYEFVNWTVKDANGSDQSPLGTAAIDLTFSNSNRLYKYTANFQEKHYTLTVNADPAEAITVSGGSGTYNYGASVNGSAVYVTPATGYDFIGWSDGVAGDLSGSNIRHSASNITMKDDVTLTAYFAASGASTKTVVATVSDPDGGSISSATGTGTVTAGTAISVTYALNPGFTFDGWTVNGVASGTAATWTGTADANKVIVANFSRASYSVTINSNDNEIGTVAGATSGVKDYGTELTLVPNPTSAKAHFREWQDALGNSLGSNVPLNVTVTSAATYTAIFYTDSVSVSVERNLALGGSVHIEDGLGANLGASTMVADGKSVILVADLSDHYHFDGWKIGTQNYSNNTHYTYTAAGTAAKTFTAQFAVDENTLAVSSADDNMGSVSVTAAGVPAAVSGSYPYGTSMTVTATPRSHYSFTGWYNALDALVSSNASYTFDLNANAVLEARFAIDQHTIAVAVSAGQSTWGEVACTPAAGTHDYGTVLHISATPATGYDFVKWNEDNNTSAQRDVRLEGDATYTAVFARHEYNVNITSSNDTWGTVSLSPAAGPYYYGATVVATAAETNTDLYKFIGWSDNQQNNVKARSFTVNGDINVTAIFANADQWSVFVQSNNTAVGTATAKVGGLDVTSVNNNTVVNIAATVTDDHYQFNGWSNGASEAATTVTVTKDTIITANFGPKSYNVTLTAGEGGSITGATSGMKVYGSTVTFRAEADEANHYHFVQWAEDGSTVAERTITVSGAETYTAVFALDNYAVTATVDNGGSAVLTPSAANYNHGSSLTITATPATNYHVTGWTKNGADYAPTTDLQHTTITVTEAAAFRVLTAKDQYTLNVSSENNSKGYITGDQNGLYDFDESVTVTAVPADNYEFVNWNGNNALDNPTLNLDMDENHTYVAYFQLRSYAVNVSAAANGQLKYSINNGAETTGNINDTYNHGTQIMLQAVPTTDGYVFDKWSDLVTSNPRSLYVSGTVNLTASFTLAEYTLDLTVNDGSMGSAAITAGAKAAYNYGDEVEITATVGDANLYKFLSWSDGNTNAVRTITMTGDAEYKALFGQLDMLTVSVLSNNNDWGTAEASATSVNLNDNVTVTATPAANYHLVGWSDLAGYNTTLVRTGVHITNDTIITAIFAIDTHTVTLTAGTYGNTVNGAGDYAHGSTATLYAEPAAHCHFVGWTGDITSASNPVNVVVNNDQDITANFGRDTVRIQASAVNGTVNFNDSIIYYDSVCQLTATPADHYSHFKGWTRNGLAIAGDETITVDATADGIYQATFAIDTVQLTVAVNDAAMGSVNGPVSGKYIYGTPVSLTAVPAAHYHFTGWTGSNTSASEAISFILEGDSAVTANFAINEHMLTIDVDPASVGMGTVNDVVNGSYAYGTSIDIEATPNDGMSFTEWSDGPTVASRTITMGESDITINAVFDTIYYNVKVVANDPTMATILGLQSQYVWNDVVTFTAHNLDTNLYKFIGWSDGQHGLDTVRVETIQSDLNLTAIFTDKEKLSVYVQSNNQAWGTAAASSNAVNINHSVTLTATPTANHHFVAWMNGAVEVSTDASYTFDVTENVNYTAIFRTDTHMVTLVNNDGHVASMSGDGWYDWNSAVTVSAVAAEHYDFAGWVDDNSTLVSTDNPFTFTMGTADTNLEATFTEHIYTITVNAQNGGSIVKGDGDFAYNSLDTLVAEANDHFAFGGWLLNGNPVPSTNGDSLIFTVTGNATYTATFIEDAQYTVSLMSENLAMGTVTGAKTLHEGDLFNIIATPKTHYHFVNWYYAADPEAIFGTAADTSFAASTDLDLVARFAIDTFALTVATDGNGAINGAGVYDYGTTVTLEAVPNEHYHLYKWYKDNGDSITNTPTLNVQVKSDTNINATFERNTYNIIVNAENGHDATGAGAYLAEATATISAQANDNYHFYTWRKNGLDIANSTETMEVEVTGNDTYTAVYSENDAFRVYVQSANLATGTVDGNAAYHVGNNATVNATPAAHYHFLKWTDNTGAFISSDPTYDFIVTSDTTLTAYFEIDTHEVSFKAADNGMLAGAGYYDWNSQVTVTATPAEHYHFMAWTDTLGNEVSTVNPYSFNITGDTALTARFDIDTHDVTLIEENGSIVTAKLRYTYGEAASFTAVADDDYHFVSWSNGELDTTVTVNIYSDTTVEAIFAIDSHYVSFADVENVTLSDSGWYNIDETVTVNAEPALHYDFVKWMLGTDSVANTEAYSFIMPNTDIELSAVVELTTYSLTFGAENGSTDITNVDITALDEITVIASAQDSNYTFSHWTKNGVFYADATSDTLTIIAEGNDNYVAVYTENDQLTVRVYSANIATGSVVGDSTYHIDNNAVVVATPAAHYHFLYWVNRYNEVVSTDAEYNFVISENEILTAYFEIDSHYTAIHAYYSGYDVTEYEDDSIYFDYGLTIRFTAAPTNPEAHHHFMYWVNEAQEIVSYENPLYIALTSDTVLIAWYDIDTFDVTLEAENGAILTDTLRYTYGQDATFEAVAADRYHFVSWSNGELDTTVTVTINSDTTVSAIFEKDTVLITLEDNLNGELLSYYFPWGVDLTVVASDYPHYHFKGFFDEDSNLLSLETPMTYTTDSDAVITAIYAIDTHTVTLVAENGTILTDTLRYTYGESATFVAQPADNYNFAGWMVDGISVNATDTLTITIEDDVTVEALFTIDVYNFAVASNSMARGYVTGTQSGNYNRGSAIQVVAHANEYNDFVGWFNANDETDTIATTDTLNFLITADTNIVAVFTTHLFTVDAIVNDTAMGSVTGTGLFEYHGLTTVAAVPAEGHHFVMWADSVTDLSRLVYVENDITFEAIFAIDTHYVTVNVNDTLMGSATGEGWYNWGDTVVVTAAANEHFNFIGFNGSTDRVDTISFVVRADTTITAYFDYTYLRIYSQFPNGNVNINVDGVDANTTVMPVIAHYGDSITMTATPDTHYHFVQWVEYSISYDTVLFDSVVYETVENTEIDPGTGEPIIVLDTVNIDTLHLSTINTIRTADTSYSDITIGYRIYTDRYIDAVFERNEVTLQLLGMHVVLNGAGTYLSGDTVTVTATPDQHYVFVGWNDGTMTTDSLNGEQYTIVDSNLSYTFVIEDNMTLWAITEGELLTVELLTADDSRGTLEGAGTYHYGDIVTVRAIANEGYTFEGWNDGNSDTVRTFTIVENVVLVASFHKVGIQTLDDSHVTIYAHGDNIYVKGAEGQTVRIFDAVGRIVSTATANSETYRTTLNASGVYMVQVGNAPARRVMIVR